MKKKWFLKDHSYLFSCVKKIVKIMRLSIFLIVLTSLQSLALDNFAQGSKLNIKVENTTLSEVLQLIEKESEYFLFYNNKVLDLNEIVTLDIKNKSVVEVLDILFKDKGVTYTFNNKQIILSKKEGKGDSVQQKSVSGTVTDKNGQPLPGVTIVLKGTTNGTTSNSDGEFSLSRIPENGTLVFSFIGLETLEVSVDGQSVVDVVMQETSVGVDEVVVTALGIKKLKKRVGYSVQEVKGESLQKAKAPTVIESLTGKIAGVIVANTSEFFGDPQVYLRGKQPLIVIDGVPVSADGWNFNSDDIENISVLKGPVSAALYGSRGLNGAIQITLKKGVQQEEKTTVSFNSTNTFQTSFIRIPRAQTEFGPGSRGQYEYYDGRGGGINDSDYDIWGPRFDGRLLPQWDSPINPETGERIPTPWVTRNTNNLDDFLQTGFTGTYNVTVKNTGKYGSVILSDTYRKVKGIVPGSKLDINTLRIAGDLNLSKKFKVEASLQYNTQETPNIPRTEYGPTSPIYLISIWGGAHWDINDMKNYWEEGKEGIEQRFAEKWRYNNPWFWAKERKRSYDRSDIIAFAKLNYKINDKMNVFVRHHIHDDNLIRESRDPFSFYDYGIPDREGRYAIYNYKTVTKNTDFLFNYADKFFNDQLELNTSLGGNVLNDHYRNSSAGTSNMVVPGLYTLSNSAEKVLPGSYLSKKAVNSLYTYVDLGFKDLFFVNATLRRDRSSALIEGNDAFFYPSVSVSAIVDKMVDLPDLISFFKLRGAYAKVGGDLGAYSAINTLGTSKRRNMPTAWISGTLIDPNLQPQFNSSFEYGADLRFFDNRLGVDVTYFNLINGPQIYDQSISNATGYGYHKTNGREVERYGWEVVLTGTPVKTQDFSWDMTLNWDMYRETLKSLPDNLDGSPRLAEGRTEIGDRTGSYWYYNWQKTPDGDLIIGSNGLPLRTEHVQKQGYYEPDWTFGLTNNLSYKNFDLSFLIDGRVGGFLFDNLTRDLWRSGSHPDAIGQNRELGNQGIKTMLVPGKIVVSGEATYDPEGNIIEDTREYADNTQLVFYEDWAKRYKADWPSVTLEKTFVKLREVSLTYNFTDATLQKLPFSKASFSVVARNLFYWTKDDTYADLDSFTISGRSGVRDEAGLQLPSMRTIGFNIDLTF
ncbi:SusC/RagA family TonB-linked outer membrane protein [Maribellus luteus]|uniref:SusC/RagA family TonB-linked outer membrane protein n=1 Tax=Maribellus luteus TaxID=2305463 RepID=A0A399T955_9BACT|nr:SusC/RagA family TonB-linked outer membrane protein [Maribellus luteus]